MNNNYRRIKVEIEDLKANPPQGLTIKAEDDNFLQFKGVIEGPEGTPYEGGNIKFRIELSEYYPHKCPSFYFNPPLFHLNVQQTTGELDSEILGNWRPTIKLRKICEEAIRIIKEPTPYCACDYGDLFINNRAEYERLAREWTQHNAMP